MFDFAWSELALIAVVALVVIGPKDLPRVMRVVGQWVRRARAVAREFQGSLDQMMREAELDDIKRHIDRASSFNLDHEIRRTVDPTGELQSSLDAPVLTNPLAGAPKPVEATPLPSPVSEVKVETPLAVPHQGEVGEAKPAAVEPEKHTP
jgi:sec-independent protein translocase protein TatB